ncbi:histidine utilization repressor [Craterilacuibacter sp. RT1T]|uniref:histidine utilization repressor n=1 Tax=Craterilacuibacter sp. RT1T TaxID=2942211 RepID=UPI0020C0E0C3|nr:histidine utilization repressor [Craterilacuibacter sp. RT1T]MCL6263051.1 histidine utilization repressor [Craterilacuibacter sp. RT1T]
MSPNTSKPQYLHIRDFILDGIRERRFTPGAKVPAEVELARQFGVSRMTVNKAVRDLAEAGILVRHAGDGTYVAKRQAESPLLGISNIADEISARGYSYHAEVHFVRTEAASDEVALRLGLPSGAPVFHSLIVHFEGEAPLQIEDRYLNPRWVPDYLAQDFTLQTPGAYLLHTCPLSDIEHTVEAVLPDEAEQALLKLPPHSPCLRVLRRTWSGKHLVSFARLLHPGNKYKLRSQARVPK